MSSILPRPEHQIALQDIANLMKKHEKLPPLELLALAANFVGKLVALQDQRKHSAEAIMETVAHNIEQGNREVVALLKTKGNG